MTEEKKAAQEEQISEIAETTIDQEKIESNDNVTQTVEMEQLQDTSPTQDTTTDLETILDVFVSLSVEIGQSRISIRDLLQLNQGSIVRLDRAAGSPLDVMINNTLIAHGEVVVANEKYGIRLTDIVNTQERIKRI